jgi:hypothetical protein
VRSVQRCARVRRRIYCLSHDTNENLLKLQFTGVITLGLTVVYPTLIRLQPASSSVSLTLRRNMTDEYIVGLHLFEAFKHYITSLIETPDRCFTKTCRKIEPGSSGGIVIRQRCGRPKHRGSISCRDRSIF